ncbi:MAG: dihydrofolate reductase [Bacteroidales bacterium]|nr:dihydrofolate reductase [Bacteroidales bacterium]MCB9027847.1 dihydrofolate reductase [Bacteroidales bacterium]MDD3735747.1 dihydrofolate reductase [Bacteroidales bacterium]NLD63445.1 dihydrofolate reductase [Bacteroidales bacterium]HNT92823.1 dihydrofolate reductase [Bacteroidales bacterium]
MITIIVATDRNNGIGYNNGLLAHIPGDLRRFREITMGHSLIMGKKTWESLPNKPLAGRRNIVLTDNELDCFDCAETARTIEEALALCEPGKEIFIIGGGSVYRQFMPLADRLLVTHIHAEFEADTYFPEIDSDEWYIAEQEDYLTEEPDQLSFSYTTYLRLEKPVS